MRVLSKPPISRKKRVVGDERPKIKMRSDFEVPCPWCEGGEKHQQNLWFIGPWHSPKYMLKCEKQKMAMSGWSKKSVAFFDNMLRDAGYDPIEVREVMKDEMRKTFAPPEKKNPTKRALERAEESRIRLARLRELKSRDAAAQNPASTERIATTPPIEAAEPQDEPQDDVLMRVIRELRREYGHG